LTASFAELVLLLLSCRFRRLAMKHHPDIEPSESSRAEFSRICEAYDVLSTGRVWQAGVACWCSHHLQHQHVVTSWQLWHGPVHAIKQQSSSICCSETSVSCATACMRSEGKGLTHATGLGARHLCLQQPCRGDADAAKLKGTYDLYGEDVLKSTSEGMP